MGTELFFCILFWVLSWAILGGHIIFKTPIQGWWRPIFVATIVFHIVMSFLYIGTTNYQSCINVEAIGNPFIAQLLVAFFFWAASELLTVVVCAFISWTIGLIKWTCNLD